MTEPSSAETSAVSPEDGASTGEADAKNKPTSGKDESETSGRFWLWIAGFFVVMSVELYVYGHAGEIQICVGQEGVTDFALVGAPRTLEGFAKIPICSNAENLGMWSRRTEAETFALKDACRKAAPARPAVAEECRRHDGRWRRQVSVKQVPPWDRRLYRRILLLD